LLERADLQSHLRDHVRRFANEDRVAEAALETRGHDLDLIAPP
jgi:hypothetical protein